MQRRIQSRIRPEGAAQTVLGFLAGRFTYHQPGEWAEIIKANRVLLNGSATTAAALLQAGDLLEYTAFDTPEPFVNLDVQIIHDDDDIMVVNKPPNLPCHPGGRYFNHTLWAVLKTTFKVADPALVNRIDRETSGLVIVAKHERAARICHTQFAHRRVTKQYLALVEGTFPDALEAVGQMSPDLVSGVHKRRVFTMAEGAGPAEGGTGLPELKAETTFKGLAHHQGMSLVEAIPRTGRLHQIRATLHALGFPVVGDKLYGPDPAMFLRFCTDALSAEDRLRLRMNRQALHAVSLELRHPHDGQTVRYEAPLPEDMLRLMGPMAAALANRTVPRTGQPSRV
jgi:23S rRNA pseudouridine955/2504/2580 synthase/23S rRNA pseudouridine1911/1915/1917 synthase